MNRELDSCPHLDPITSSDLRQIPDNQEVLLSPDSNISLVVEVLQSVREGQAATDLEEAIK